MRHIILLFLFVQLMPGAIRAEADVRKADKTLRTSLSEDTYNLALWMDILEDESRRLSIDDITSGSFQENYIPNENKALNFGVTSSVFWLRFRVGAAEANNGNGTQERVLDLGEAFAGRVKWSLYNQNGDRMASGGSRQAKDSYARLEVTAHPRDYYLQVQSTTSFLMYPRLFTWESYLDNIRIKTVWFGLFYGIIFAVAVYNLFLFFSFNDNSYLWYVFHLVFVFLYFAGINGLSSAYILPDRPELQGMLNRSFLGLMIATMALLTRSFLMSRLKTPKIDLMIIALFIAACFMTLLNLIFHARLVVNLLIIMGIIVPSMMVLAAWGALRSGFKPARLFMIAWGLFVIGVVLFALTSGGIIPFSFPGFNGFQIGSAAAAILLSLALSDRIRMLRVERASLKQSMERVTKILDTIECGVFLIESNSRTIMEINNAAENIIGRKREEIIGKPCWQFIRSAEKKGCPIMDLCLSEDHREDSLTSASGENIPVLKSARLIEIGGRDLIIESFVDISDLKRAEEAVRRSEAKFRSLFESSRDAVMILDRNRYIDCNKAALGIFGCKNAEEFIGKQLSDFTPELQPSGGSSSEEAAKHIENAFERGSYFFEWMHKRLNGEEFPAEIMLSEVEVEGKQMLQALARDITKRKAMEDELKRLASTDPLTGADNRRSFLDKGAYELLRSRRYNHSFSFLMLDIDHFKSINDTFGHYTGDLVLKELVSESKKVLRATDLFGRLGGEEFAVILPETDAETAVKAGERLRNELSNVRVESDQGPVSFTVSIGLAMREGDTDTLVNIMGRADAALYKAKDAGRNRLVRA